MFRRNSWLWCASSIEVSSSQRKVVAWFSAQGFDLASASHIIQKEKGRLLQTSDSSLHIFPREDLPKRSADSNPKVATHKLRGTALSIGRGNDSGSVDSRSLEKLTNRKPIDVLCLNALDSKKTIVVFADGGLVGWDISWPEMLHLRKMLKDAVKGLRDPSSKPTASLLGIISERNTLVECLKFQTYSEYRDLALASYSSDQLARSNDFVVDAPEDERNFVDGSSDTIVLSSDDDHKAKIAFSYALAQSVRLEAIDAAASPISGELRRWQSNLASTGKILCSLMKLRKAKTHTLGLLEDLNFKQHIETSPKIFWTADYQHLRGVYKSACGHLEIGERGGALKTKLETIDDSVSYLHHEVHASSNEFLTWVIIVLITLELFEAMGFFSGLEFPDWK